MKKRVFFAFLAVIMILSMTACGDNDPKPQSETDGTTQAAATTTATPTTTASQETPTTTTTAPDADAPYVFTCDELHFSLTLPASWEGAFTHRHDGNTVSFYELSNHMYDSATGHLFTIRFMSPEVDIDFPECTSLGSHGGYNVIALRPSDVQFDFQNEERKEKYLAMDADVKGILDTFVYEEVEA